MPSKNVHALTLRLDPKLVARVDRVTRQYEHHVAAGFPGRMLSRAQMMRLALQMGLDSIEAKLKKRGPR